jgi:hypothetical protein
LKGNDEAEVEMMIFLGTILLVTLTVPGAWQDSRKKESNYTVTLEETGCEATRRIRCRYHFVEVSAGQDGKNKRHFNLMFYASADQTAGKGDAISRLDRFFRITREPSPPSGADNADAVGFKEPTTLRINGSKYEFSREDGEKVIVDVEKKTRP